jgi:cytochrome c553
MLWMSWMRAIESSNPEPSSTIATEIQEALLAFRSDRRQGTVMNKIAKGYTDAEIEILAEYLANASGDRRG